EKSTTTTGNTDRASVNNGTRASIVMFAARGRENGGTAIFSPAMVAYPTASPSAPPQTESVLLSVCGGALGLAVGYATMAGLKMAVPPFSLPRAANITIDARVPLFTLALSVLPVVVVLFS